MSILGFLIDVLNCILLAAILVLIGAIIVWAAAIFEWPIPWNIQRLYLLVVLIVFIICVITGLVGAPMFHVIPPRL